MFEARQQVLLVGFEQRHAYYNNDAECTLRISKLRVGEWREYVHHSSNNISASEVLYRSAVVELSGELQLEDPMLIEQKHYGSVLEELSSELQLEDPMQLTEHAYYGSPPEELSSEVQLEDPMQLTEQTCYGSAPEHLWSELQTEEDAETVDDERFDSVRNMDSSELELVEEIAQGGQAHVYLAKWKTRGGREVVVKWYKGRGVDVVHLRRPLAKARADPAYSLGI
jgi:hypothetical protein